MPTADLTVGVRLRRLRCREITGMAVQCVRLQELPSQAQRVELSCSLRLNKNDNTFSTFISGS